MDFCKIGCNIKSNKGEECTAHGNKFKNLYQGTMDVRKIVYIMKPNQDEIKLN
jgi:hypothetical protein